jgi:hypothetical protein
MNTALALLRLVYRRTEINFGRSNRNILETLVPENINHIEGPLLQFI